MRKRIAIICGGPSAERGISLNSARSLYDNFDKSKYELSLIYFNPKLDAFAITPAQIYSNTPLDFDYKLKDSTQKLSEKELKTALKKVELAFPAIHGLFGEDGQLQRYLEKIGVKYIGSGPEALKNTSDKYLCQRILEKNGFYTTKNYIVRKGDAMPDLAPGQYVIKPLHGGSSIGVQHFESVAELKQKIDRVFQHEPEGIIEPFCDGKEFTIMVFENAKNEPVALFPTEIEFSDNPFFDYRKKYLASTETRLHLPARFDNKTMEHIQKEAERAFKCLGMKDFARLDGWLLQDGQIWFSDVNGISGMEQNSSIFLQTALLGLSHRQVLDFLVTGKIEKNAAESQEREEIPVLFGGDTAERQVSVMSGTNVWIKLKSSRKYKPVPLCLTFEKKIFRIPHFLCLHHTVEEIEEKIALFRQKNFLASLLEQQQAIFKRLGINPEDCEEKLFMPEETTLEKIAQKYSFLFVGLHGGEGENGGIQAKLDKLKLPYNGPGAKCSKICMDKFETGRLIENANIDGAKTAKKIIINIHNDTEKTWHKIQKQNFAPSVILKPRADGCSAGVIRVNNFEQFKKAISYFRSDYRCIPEKAIHESHGKIDLPNEKLTEVLIEDYIMTDKVVLKDMEIEWQKVSDIVEVTIGVMGPRDNLEVFYPSQTIACQEILSLEEKFMGGTGINLTPPPSVFVNSEAIVDAKKIVKKVAETLGIEGYSRIDTFMNVKSGELTIIEANTLPGLTASTVIFHQALAHDPPMTPLDFIEKIIEIGKNRFLKLERGDIKHQPGNQTALKTQILS